MSETITRNDLKAILEEVGRTTITVDSALNNTSENPVQNKVIYSALGNKADANSVVTSVNGSTGAVTGLQTTANLVTSVTSASTNAQYPSAKCLYDTIGDIETLLAAL